MILGLCLALVSQIIGGPGLDVRAASKDLYVDTAKFVDSSEHFARMAEPLKPELDPFQLETPCPSPFEDRLFVAPSIQVSGSLARHYAPLWLDGSNFWVETPSLQRPRATWPALPRGIGATMQMQAKRFENPDKQRSDPSRRSSGGGLGTLGPTALGVGMAVAREFTGPDIVSMRSGSGSSGASFRLKPVIWRSTLGLRAEF